MSPTMSEFSGIITALATPFKNGQFHEPDFERLLENQIDQGVNGFVINGTTGESPTLFRSSLRTTQAYKSTTKRS